MVVRRPIEILLSSVLVLLLASPAAAQTPQRQTEHYAIYGDLPDPVLDEAALRLEKMAEVYGARSSRDRSSGRMPVFLFSSEADFLAAGGTADSAGLYRGGVLIALAQPGEESAAWRVLQHEGFHQFAQRAFGDNLPIWLDEGLAEYFGQSLFTGDGFVTGIIPDWRLKRIRAHLREEEFLPMARLLGVSPSWWEKQFSLRHYDQAWSLAQFLLHGEQGRYAQAFLRFAGDVGAGMPWRQAWKAHLPELPRVERQWRDYWLNLPDDPTADLRLLATAQTLNSLLARAISQGQSFESFDQFVQTAKAGELRSHPNDWLPPMLLIAIEEAQTAGGDWSIKDNRLQVSTPDGRRLIGQYTLDGGRVEKAFVEVAR